MGFMALFSNRFKTAIQAVQMVLITTVLILSVVRILVRPAAAPRNRAGTMSLGMSAKSLVILLYEILTERVRSLKRWQSLKAYAILNSMEIVFWSAVTFLLLRANTQFCEGTYCGLGWVVVVLSMILSSLASYMAVLSIKNFREHRDQQRRQAVQRDRAKYYSPPSAYGLEHCFDTDPEQGIQTEYKSHTHHQSKRRSMSHSTSRGDRPTRPSRQGRTHSAAGRHTTRGTRSSHSRHSSQGQPLMQSRPGSRERPPSYHSSQVPQPNETYDPRARSGDRGRHGRRHSFSHQPPVSPRRTSGERQYSYQMLQYAAGQRPHGPRR